ncbi:light-inducible protein CPRF2 [Selaginella moellendorffii]|nr:light-inducible protein CPRF2 [Selaginella moellendorffii]|eukprot:XP_024542766.1 light-inducible protein CPRF2 [Selaginella moellendorffii]
MGAWDDAEAGVAGIYAGGAGSSKESVLPRTPSVDDLFAPLWRLEVQQQSLGQIQDLGAANWKSVDRVPKFPAGGPERDFAPGPALPALDHFVPPSTSTSEEDQQLRGVDDKKQKRMLSNRESARRSRLRKQQHMEELRSQLLDLRAQNSHILGKLSVASQQFSQISHDNQLLRLQASELGRQLQRLHRQASVHHPDGLHAFGFGTSHLDPPGVALRSSSPPPRSAYAIVTDVLQGSSLCS